MSLGDGDLALALMKMHGFSAHVPSDEEEDELVSHVSHLLSCEQRGEPVSDGGGDLVVGQGLGSVWSVGGESLEFPLYARTLEGVGGESLGEPGSSDAAVTHGGSKLSRHGQVGQPRVTSATPWQHVYSAGLLCSSWDA